MNHFSSGPIMASRPGVPSRVIQGFFPGGRPKIIQASPAAGPVRPQVPGPVQAGPVSLPAPILPGRSGTGALQSALRPGQPPRAILPAKVKPGTVQPASPLRPQVPQPILPQRATTALQPRAGDAFALPANFTLKPPCSGQPLPEPIQKKMESFFKTSFADVRIHVGHEAPSIGALAFTHGTDLYFAPGQYNPQSTHGQQLLGHELTHVLQQRAGRVHNPLGVGVAVVQDPALEAEAERMGQRAASAASPIQAKPAGAGSVVAPLPGTVARPTTISANGAILPARAPAPGSVQRKPDPIIPGKPAMPAKMVPGTFSFSGAVVQRIVEPGAQAGTRVFVTTRDGRFAKGAIVSEVNGGYRVKVKEVVGTYRYSMLNLHDPRVVDQRLGEEKWREFVRGQHQNKGKTAYDADGTDFGKKLPKGQSYSSSMTNAQEKVATSLGIPLDINYVEEVHHLGSAHKGSPEWRNEKSGGRYVGDINITLLDQHAEKAGIKEIKELVDGPMRYVGLDKEGHKIATRSMTAIDVKNELQRVIETYQRKIESADSQDAILMAIAQFTQDLARLHPFEDANTRTNMLLLNKLLVENGFSPAIVNDPKHFYLNTLYSWKEKIMDGMAHWQKIGGAVGIPSQFPPILCLSGLLEEEELVTLRRALQEQQEELRQREFKRRALEIAELERKVIELNGLFVRYAELTQQASERTGRVAINVEDSASMTATALSHLI